MNVMEEKIDFRGEFDTYGTSGIIVLACSEKSKDKKNNKLKKITCSDLYMVYV